MKNYNSFEEIEYDLKRLSLERQISFEQLKGIKGEIAEDLKPLNWITTIGNYAVKYGFFVLFKKLFK